MNHTTLIDELPQREPNVPSEDFILRKYPKWTLAHWCIVTFAASFLILLLLPEARLNDFELPRGTETVRVASSLAIHGRFANPFITMRTGSTAHVAPIYPFLYSLILRFFGFGYAALFTAWMFNVACVALQMALLPLLSSRLNMGVLPGIVAATLGTISLDTTIDSRWECFLTATLLLGAFLLTNRAFHANAVPSTLSAGAMWGVLVLTNPVTVLLLFAWPLCLILTQSGERRAKQLRLFASIVALALLIVSPWILRNDLRFGTFIFVRDNLGLELYTGNNDCASPDLRGNIDSGCHARTHPNPTAAIAAQLAAAGEVPFYRAKLHEASRWIADHPAAFLRLTAQRFGLFWFPRADRRWESILVWVVTLLSVPGLWRVAQKNRAAACVIGTAWLLFPLVYYLVPFEPRYRYPIYWTSLLPAAYFGTEIFRRVRPLQNSDA